MNGNPGSRRRLPQRSTGIPGGGRASLGPHFQCNGLYCHRLSPCPMCLADSAPMPRGTGFVKGEPLRCLLNETLAAGVACQSRPPRGSGSPAPVSRRPTGPPGGRFSAEAAVSLHLCWTFSLSTWVVPGPGGLRP